MDKLSSYASRVFVVFGVINVTLGWLGIFTPPTPEDTTRHLLGAIASFILAIWLKLPGRE